MALLIIIGLLCLAVLVGIWLLLNQAIADRENRVAVARQKIDRLERQTMAAMLDVEAAIGAAESNGHDSGER